MASILNQVIDQGTTFSKQITVYQTDGVTVQNLTGYTTTSQLRKIIHLQHILIFLQLFLHQQQMALLLCH